MSAAGLRVDLYRVTTYTKPGWHLDEVFPTGTEYRWRLWSSSSIIAASTQGYEKRSRAIANIETVTGGAFEKLSAPDFPKPYGVVHRTAQDADYAWLYQDIPVRLVES